MKQIYSLSKEKYRHVVANMSLKNLANMIRNGTLHKTEDIISNLNQIPDTEIAGFEYVNPPFERSTLFQLIYDSVSTNFDNASITRWLHMAKAVTLELIRKGCDIQKMSIHYCRFNVTSKMIVDLNHSSHIWHHPRFSAAVLDFFKFVIGLDQFNVNLPCTDFGYQRSTPLKRALSYSSIVCIPHLIAAGADGSVINTANWVSYLFELDHQDKELFSEKTLELIFDSGVNFSKVVGQLLPRFVVENYFDDDLESELPPRINQLLNLERFFYYRGHLSDNSQLPTDKKEKLRSTLLKYTTSPRSLQSWARLIIRKHCARNEIKLPRLVHQLTSQHQISQIVGDYLLICW